jgi:hypothetical protein
VAQQLPGGPRRQPESHRSPAVRAKLTSGLMELILFSGSVSPRHGLALGLWPAGGKTFDLRVIPWPRSHRMRVVTR